MTKVTILNTMLAAQSRLFLRLLHFTLSSLVDQTDGCYQLLKEMVMQYEISFGEWTGTKAMLADSASPANGMKNGSKHRLSQLLRFQT